MKMNALMMKNANGRAKRLSAMTLPDGLLVEMD